MGGFVSLGSYCCIHGILRGGDPDSQFLGVGTVLFVGCNFPRSAHARWVGHVADSPPASGFPGDGFGQLESGAPVCPPMRMHSTGCTLYLAICWGAIGNGIYAADDRIA